MANTLAGAEIRLLSNKDRPKRNKADSCVVAHIAVSNSKTLPPSGGNDWHFYLPKDGPAIQYVDLDYCSGATYQGNGRAIAWESEGGVGDDLNAGWTDNQIHWAARILAMAHLTEGVPLVAMADSRKATRGQGYHRLGVNPYRVGDGELWSKVYGKVCPGNRRIEQVPLIVALAGSMVGGGGPVPVQQPQPQPQPQPVPTPNVERWPFAGNDYVGDINGPAASHGGYYVGERGFISNVQRWLVYAGVSSVDWRRWNVTTWADGIFGPESIRAAEKFFAGDRNPGRIYSDDYAQLTRFRR